MEDEKQIVISGQHYSLVELPGSSTPLVVEKRSELGSEIELKTLVEDLGRVGRFIRVAYNGVKAAGPKFTELQIEVQGLGYDVTKLCDKSAITMSRFKRACSTILTDLKTTYLYLLDNFEDMALDTLSAVSDLAGEMAAAANELRADFDEEALKVRDVLTKTERSQGKQERCVREMKTKQEEFELRKDRQQDLLKEARKAEEVADQRFREMEMQEDKAVQQLGDDDGFWTKIANGLTTKVLGTRVIGMSPEQKQRHLQEIKEQKMKALEKKIEREQLRLEAFQKLTEFAVSIENCKGEKDFANAAAQSLQEAVQGLKMLSAYMMQAAVFWTQMQNHCKDLGDDKLKKEVDKAMQRYDDAKRQRFWTSSGFKTKAVNFYAGWVALDGVCGEYMTAIQGTRRELYKYIMENPTFEDAERNVKQLANHFKQELGEAQKAIAEKGSEMTEELQSLKEE